MSHSPLSRRSFLALLAAAPLALKAQDKRSAPSSARKHVPIGIQMYSVKDEEKKDLPGTLKALREMGYEGVEFWGPYFQWTTDHAKQVRAWLNDAGLKCFSAHTRAPYWVEEHFPHAIELNLILGSRYIVMDTPLPRITTLDGWKQLAETLSKAADKLRPTGLRGGYHNYPQEWRLVEGVRPIDILTANTPKDFAFQLDTATCLASGGDPVAFIKANPGRVKSYHLKDWSSDKEKGYRVVLGEGIGPWKELIDAAENIGGVDYYLIEQEGTGGRFTPMETAKKCLDNFKAIRAG